MGIVSSGIAVPTRRKSRKKRHGRKLGSWLRSKPESPQGYCRRNSPAQNITQGSPFQLGEKVERRDTRGVWGVGYVTNLNPLKVTVDKYSLRGIIWHEVRKLPAQD